jgi:hypothetical protein
MNVLDEAYRAGMMAKLAEVAWDDVKQDALDFAIDNPYLVGGGLGALGGAGLSALTGGTGHDVLTGGLAGTGIGMAAGKPIKKYLYEKAMDWGMD